MQATILQEWEEFDYNEDLRQVYYKQTLHFSSGQVHKFHLDWQMTSMSLDCLALEMLLS